MHILVLHIVQNQRLVQHHVCTQFFSAPTRRPNLYYLRNSSSTSLLVKWNPPPSDFQHGIIRGYKVFYQTASNCTTTPEPILRTSTPKPPSTSTARPTSTATPTTKRDDTEHTGRKRRAVNSQVGLKSEIVYKGFSLNITGLEKWTCYTAYVICWTVDESPQSISKEARTAEDSEWIFHLSSPLRAPLYNSFPAGKVRA